MSRSSSAANTRRVGWVGIDRVRLRTEAHTSRGLVPLVLVGALLAALALAALRVDLIRTRYGLAETLRTEKELLEERRALLARGGTLRDPAQLARLAKERGLVRPRRVIDLRTREMGAARP